MIFVDLVYFFEFAVRYHVGIGAVVGIHGIKSRQDLNQMQGTVQSWNAQKGRWDVRIPTGELVALKPENLYLANQGGHHQYVE